MTETVNAPRNLIFVGGAPRSGTTVTHALICTAPEVSNYHPEISFVRPLYESYAVGAENWNSHTKRFFKQQAELREHVCFVVERSLRHVWKALGQPTVLCVKDPLLTPNFPVVRALTEWPCQFITVLRHPHDVIRSQQEVYTRSGVEMTSVDVYRLARDYTRSYAHLQDPAMTGAVLFFRYEDLGKPWQVEQLRSFIGLPGIDPARVWQEQGRDPGRAVNNPFYSPKYLNAIDTTPRLDPLSADFRDIINGLCAPLMEQFGYATDGGHAVW